MFLPSHLYTGSGQKSTGSDRLRNTACYGRNEQCYSSCGAGWISVNSRLLINRYRYYLLDRKQFLPKTEIQFFTNCPILDATPRSAMIIQSQLFLIKPSFKKIWEINYKHEIVK